MKWTTKNIPDLSGKIAIVTGASSGLGFEVARQLAAKHCTVIMACRDTKKGEQAKQQIELENPAAALQVECVDLSSMQSIIDFSKKIKSEYPCINLLINNAATLNVQGKTKDGFELIFGTNHLGTCALTAELLPSLMTCKDEARIITVGSDSHKLANIEFDEFNPSPSADCLKMYSRSKLANILFAFELNKRLQHANKNLISLVAHPGFAKSHLSDRNNTSPSALLSNLLSIGMSIFAQPTPQGALPILYAATAPEALGGDYIGPDGFGELRGYPKKSQASKQAYDDEKAIKLWELTEEKLNDFNIKFNLPAAPKLTHQENNTVAESRRWCGLR